MKLFTTFFLLLTLNVFGQNDTVFIRKNIKFYPETEIVYKTDTIIFKTRSARNILIGDTILAITQNQQIAKGYGLFFEKIEVKDCGEYEIIKPNEIIEFKKENGKWIIELLVYSNCCQDFLADIRVEKDDTLNLIYYNYGMYCDCDCPFELTYTIQTMDFDSLKKIKSIIINGDYSTEMQLER